MRIVFPIPVLDPLESTAHSEIITSVLGHEGERSLLSQLIRMDLATEIEVETDTQLEAFATL